ncbi:alcohol acetyltransferase [Pseudomassariella vexata]|uniref:Alcohol acetyltransferase n=1 Tax=Pseudomassariella vexata TaxID=1141098 RepID=A0A1Y2DQZ5_9PEZI|nr:alcohol acetyltransferase [Pseudomassariella vexata]ORY61713.1 alcohol acetyltransferase [Pseudomassariella vexata]
MSSMSCFHAKKGGEGQQAKVIRRFGNIECYCGSIHHLHIYYCCVVVCRYTIPTCLSGDQIIPVVKERLERAVALTVLEHPLLQAGIDDEDSKRPAWVRLESIDLRNHIEWREAEDETKDFDVFVHNVTEMQHNTPFPNQDSQPGWKVTVLQPAVQREFVEVLFAWNHAHGDGTSGRVFHETLLRKLNTHSREEVGLALKEHILQLRQDTPFTPSQEMLLKFPMSPAYALSTGWKELRPAVFAKDSATHANWAPIKKLPYSSRFKGITVDSETLQKVLVLCRQHQTTLTGLLHALCLISVANRLPKEQAPGFKSVTPFCLRRFLDPKQSECHSIDPDNIFANLVSSRHHAFNIDLLEKLRTQLEGATTGAQTAVDELQETMWAAAVSVRQDLVKRINANLKNEAVGLLKFVGDWNTEWKSQMKKARELTWEVSNIGVIDGKLVRSDENLDPEGSWTIERAIFSQSAFVPGPALGVNPISVKGGSLCITCTWQGGIIDAKLGEGLIFDLGNWLHDLGKEGRISFR